MHLLFGEKHKGTWRVARVFLPSGLARKESLGARRAHSYQNLINIGTVLLIFASLLSILYGCCPFKSYVKPQGRDIFLGFRQLNGQ